MKIAALFLGYNPQLLAGAVSSFRQILAGGDTGFDITPVVVENGEGDSAQWARDNGVAWMQLPQLSYAKAYNEAVRRLPAMGIEADWLLLCNDDLAFSSTTIWDGWLRLMADGNEVIGQKLVYPDGKLQHCGKFFTLDFYPFHPARWQPPDEGAAALDLYCPSVTFACVLIKRCVWDALGGFDEQFFYGFEDDDFCLRAKEQGASVVCSNASGVVVHAESQSTGQDTANKDRQWERFRQKWVETRRINAVLGVWPTWRSK